MDGTACRGTGETQTDENHHLAKVRVVGSNPVFRSILAGQRPFFNRWSKLAAPVADVDETNDAFVVEIELAGVKNRRQRSNPLAADYRHRGAQRTGARGNLASPGPGQ